MNNNGIIVIFSGISIACILFYAGFREGGIIGSAVLLTSYMMLLFVGIVLYHTWFMEESE